MADYPAAVVHKSYDNGDPSANPIGTGPYLPETNEVGVKQVLVKNADHTWWGTEVYGGPYLDRIEYIDLGTDPAAAVAAAGSGEIDVDLPDHRRIHRRAGRSGLGQDRSQSPRPPSRCASTRMPKSYKDVNVRKALIQCVDNNDRAGTGLFRPRARRQKTTMSARSIPNTSPCPPLVVDPAAGKAAIDAAGMARSRVRADLDRRRLAGRDLRCGCRPDPRCRHQDQADGSAGLDLLERLDEVSVQRDRMEHAPLGRAGSVAGLPLGRSLERKRVRQCRVRRAAGQGDGGCRCGRAQQADGADRADHAGAKA